MEDDDDDVPRPRKQEEDTSHHINYSEIKRKIDPENITILHTCTGEVKGQQTKFLIEQSLHFGWTVGGSLQRKDESLIPTDTYHNIFSSIVNTNTEPHDEHEDDEEALIQNKINHVFTTEEEERNGEPKLSAEEQYVLEQFK